MATLLDLASLVVVPSGYKEDVVYSVKPTDGSGDLDFTRSNDTATRVNSAGLIEKVRTNLAAYSSDFSQQYTLLNATISTNTITDPFGTSLADSHLETATSDNHAGFTDYTVISGTELTYSIYAKSIGGRNIRVSGSVGFTGGIAIVDLSNGTLLSGSTADAKVTSVGDGWYRISITATTTTTIARILVYSLNGTSLSFLGDITKGVYLFGRQLEYGVATDYIPTTTTAVSVGMTANVPRLDYSGGGCPKLLLEPQRTNLVTFSEQFDNAAWTKTASTVTANSTISPDGYQDADTLTGDGTSSTHSVYQSVSLTSGANYTISVYAKKNTNNFLQIYGFSGGYGANSWANFDLNNGVVGSIGSSATASIVNVGNGWYRCTMTTVAVSTVTDAFVLNLITSATSSRGQNSTLSTSVFLWGCQFEAGSYATSYIPTLAAAVTRGADACSKTGISSLIGQTEGVLFWEGVVLNQTDIIGINRSTANGIYITKGSGNLYRAAIYNSSNVINFADVGVKTTITKIAIAYKSGDSALFVNGSKIGSTNTTAITFNAALSEIRLNDNYLIGIEQQFQNQIIVYNTRLTDTQCIQLTTL